MSREVARSNLATNLEEASGKSLRFSVCNPGDLGLFPGLGGKTQVLKDLSPGVLVERSACY